MICWHSGILKLNFVNAYYSISADLLQISDVPLGLKTYTMPLMEPVEYISRTKETYDRLGYKPYRWSFAKDDPKFVRPSKPLSESRMGLISTSGAHVQGQVAYHYKDDTSVRVIPNTTPSDKLRFSHIMENYLVEARQNPATVFPLESLATLKNEGVIGELAGEYFSCMGGIYSQRRVKEELIPNLEMLVDQQKLDLLLLVPL
ncbi:MAG: D-proline reductase (dithiol) PrdB [Flavobacterium sp.]